MIGLPRTSASRHVTPAVEWTTASAAAISSFISFVKPRMRARGSPAKSISSRFRMCSFNPQIHYNNHSLQIELRNRDKWITVHIGHSRLVLRALPCAAAPIRVAVRDSFHELAPNTTLDIPLSATRDTDAVPFA